MPYRETNLDTASTIDANAAEYSFIATSDIQQDVTATETVKRSHHYISTPQRRGDCRKKYDMEGAYIILNY